jgi:hypothetical protein
VNQFGQHEYWGSDFAAGKTTVGVFRDERFNYTAVWSYGDWADFGFNRGDEVDFQHTQTGRKKTLIFCGVIRKRSDAADFESESALMAQWTLK